MRLGNQNQITLHLLRHGKTPANERRLYCGFSDPALSASGKKELSRLKKELIYPFASRYFHTGLQRTRETLELLYDFPQSEAVPDLREMSFGAFEMKSFEELKSDPLYLRWIEAIDTACPPGGETKADFTERIRLGLKNTANLLAPGESALILTHGGVIATLMELFFPEEKNFYQWQPACGKGYSLFFENGHVINYSGLEDRKLKGNNP